MKQQSIKYNHKSGSMPAAFGISKERASLLEDKIKEALPKFPTISQATEEALKSAECLAEQVYVALVIGRYSAPGPMEMLARAMKGEGPSEEDCASCEEEDCPGKKGLKTGCESVKA